MSLPKERVVALLAYVANIVAAIYIPPKITNDPGSPATAAVTAALVALPGFIIVWFREALSDTGFARGVLRPSPSFLVGLIGWLLLLFYPFWFVCQSAGGFLPTDL